MLFDPHGDMCLGFWADSLQCWPEALEIPRGGEVLEIGCAEADWLTPMYALRPDLEFLGIDVRDAKGRNHWAMKADVLTHDFYQGRFDAIVMISALEHIGLGAYGDPLREDGDTETLRRCARWLKPGGWVYADVPYRLTGPAKMDGKFRAYDPVTALSRLNVEGLRQVRARVIEAPHPDGPYLAIVWQKEQPA